MMNSIPETLASRDEIGEAVIVPREKDNVMRADPYNDSTPAYTAWEKSLPTGDPPLMMLWGEEEGK